MLGQYKGKKNEIQTPGLEADLFKMGNCFKLIVFVATFSPDSMTPY